MRIWAHCYSDKPYSMDKHQQGYPVDLGLAMFTQPCVITFS